MDPASRSILRRNIASIMKSWWKIGCFRLCFSLNRFAIQSCPIYGVFLPGCDALCLMILINEYFEADGNCLTNTNTKIDANRRSWGVTLLLTTRVTIAAIRRVYRRPVFSGDTVERIWIVFYPNSLLIFTWMPLLRSDVQVQQPANCGQQVELGGMGGRTKTRQTRCFSSNLHEKQKSLNPVVKTVS